MSEEKKDDETVKKVGSISYAPYEEAGTFDWTQVCGLPQVALLPSSLLFPFLQSSPASVK
jgi:hypothetical protein